MVTATAPEVHPLGYENDEWRDPRTRQLVPKSLIGNLKKRSHLAKQAAQSPKNQRLIMAACRESPLYFLNQFAWTYRPKMVCLDGLERAAGTSYIFEGKQHPVPPADTPIITWPAQDELVGELERTFKEGGMLLTDKSREQGATVICMAMLTWGILFIPNFSALVVSRNADMVDGTEDSLFGKIDYVLRQLPPWMAPKPKRKHAPPYIGFKQLGSRIIGETSSENVGQSLRTTVSFVDEAARFPNGESLVKSIQSVSSGYILASTPNGPGTEFTKLRHHAETPEGRKRIKVVTLGYWDHPLIGRNREWVEDADGVVTGQAGKGYWETPAFRAARGMIANRKAIRENWLIDHETSGMLVLDPSALARMRKNVAEPKRGSLVDGEFREHQGGRLAVWCDLDKHGRPPINTNFVIGCDFSQGVEGSNTVLAVMDRSTGKIVAEYADPTIAPHEAAGLAMEMGYFFGGQLGYAFVIWERNGPGMGFGHEIVKRGYEFLYYQRQETQRHARRTKQWGWQSSRATKEILFSDLNQALGSGKFATPSEPGLDDMSAWIFDDFGRIVCGTFRDETTGAQERHGDRGIAYALTVLGEKEAPHFEPSIPHYRPEQMGAIAEHEKMFGTPDDEKDDLPFRV